MLLTLVNHMKKSFQYELFLDDEKFGFILSPLPLLRNPQRSYDNLSWGRFNIGQAEEITLTWMQKRKLGKITTQIMEAMGVSFESKEIFIVPSSGNLNSDDSLKETEFLESYVSAVKSLSINPLEIYDMPKNPNSILANKVTPESTLFFENLHLLYQLKEVQHNLPQEGFQFLGETIQKFHSDFDGLFSENSIFPQIQYCSISMIRFISYFRYFLSSISSLTLLFKSFNFEDVYFPDFIECFTVSYIPSFTHYHDSMEKCGDTVLGLCICTDIIKALYQHDLQYINQRYNWAVSNDLFLAIAEHFNFNNSIIGPIDERKVPSDCFEALAFLNFKAGGYDKVNEFWHQCLFAIDQKYFETNPQISKAIETLKVGVQNKLIVEEIGDNVPSYALKYCESLKPTYKNVFVEKSPLSQKSKMIGANFLKFAVSYYIYQRMRKVTDMLEVERHCKNVALNETVKKFGFPNGKVFKIFLGGFFLTNGFEPVNDVFVKYFVAAFELLPKRRRHHRRSSEQ